MTGTAPIWDESNTLKLRYLWGEKFPASKIAEQMGFTRNAIIGKAHRLGLGQRPKRAQPPRLVAKKPPKPKIVKATAIRIIVDDPIAPKAPTGTVEFLKLSLTTCRSVEGYSVQGGHSLPFYCSNLKKEEESFCDFHKAIYYRKRDEQR